MELENRYMCAGNDVYLLALPGVLFLAECDPDVAAGAMLLLLLLCCTPPRGDMAACLLLGGCPDAHLPGPAALLASRAPRRWTVGALHAAQLRCDKLLLFLSNLYG